MSNKMEEIIIHTQFQGEAGKYYKKIMFDKKNADPAEAVRASKAIGWGTYMQSFKPVCRSCGRRRATKSIYNTHNAHDGNYCLRCAKRRIRELNKPTIGVDEKYRLESGGYHRW